MGDAEFKPEPPSYVVPVWRGIVYGAAICLPFWVLVGLLIWWLVG